MATDDNTTSIRVASFSCYLSNPEESFVQKIGCAIEPAFMSPPETPFPVKAAKVAAIAKNNFTFKATSGGPVQDPTIAFVFPQQPKQLDRNKSKDGEISIFGADKYFNMDLDHGRSVPLSPAGLKFKAGKGMVMDLPRTNMSETPSICSEASSWNSQNALLQNSRRAGYDQTKQKKTARRRFLDTFGCQPCLDKKAVYVDKSIGHGIPKQGPSPFALTSGPYGNQSIEEQRKSLEVFGSSKTGKGDIAVNLERKLSMLTWDAIPKAQNLPTTTSGGATTVCDDMASDASSDLFEIENISSSGYELVNAHRPCSGDYMSSSCMSPTQYAPSEASIEWSVVTASAADYSSIISDYDEKIFAVSGETRQSSNKTKNNVPVGREGQKPRPSGILSCKSQKSVNVVETVHKASSHDQKPKHHPG